MDTQKVIDNIGQIGQPLNTVQINSVDAILNACEQYVVTNPKQIAYILATAYHESRLRPIEEIGKGKGHPYGYKYKQAKDSHGEHIPYTSPDELYYGRGFIQLTWYENYAYFGNLLKSSLLSNPDLALTVPVAAEIIVLGMKDGSFTGVSLSRYFAENVADPINARKIINGLDAAELIAGYYNHILPSVKQA